MDWELFRTSQVRNTGSRTATIRDVSEFTLDTAFPIPFFVSTEAVSYDLSSLLTGDGISKIIVQERGDRGVQHRRANRWGRGGWRGHRCDCEGI